MLIGINPLLGAELLYCLAQMGHGDDIAIVDGNFPAASTAQRLVRLDGANSSQALQAILTVMPVDNFTDDALRSMAVVGDASAIPEAVEEFAKLVGDSRQAAGESKALPREAFYRAAAQAFCVVATGDTRLYANCLVRKGVVSVPVHAQTPNRESSCDV